MNNIETSQELSLLRQTNEIALAQGAASAGIPVGVIRKTMERVADQLGEDLANRLLSRLQRPESMTASVLSAPPPPPPLLRAASAWALVPPAWVLVRTRR